MDLAERAGVSISSASRAFREGESITPEVRERVFCAARELGYTPNFLARGLKSSKSNLIGLDICDIQNPFYAVIIKAMEEELKARGYQLILSYSNGDHKAERKNLEMFAGSQVMGIAFMPKDAQNRELVRQLSQKGIAMLQFFNKAYDFLDTVSVKDDSGAYYATRHLLENGHRRILLLNVCTPYSDNRADGYCKALREAGVEAEEALNVTFTEEKTLEEIKRLLTQRKPTAVLAGVYGLGKDVVRACRQLGLKIPKDVSLITFDDVEWPELLDITAVCQPTEYIGLAAARMLLDRINGRIKSEQPVITAVEPKLNVRDSVRRLNTAGTAAE